jgi:hypothetical protein
MDLTGFIPEDDVLLIGLDCSQEDATSEGMNAIEALKHIDDHWYKKIAGKARCMDLIGDYAGNERFILDGKFAIRSWRRFAGTYILSRGVFVAARPR